MLPMLQMKFTHRRAAIGACLTLGACAIAPLAAGTAAAAPQTTPQDVRTLDASQQTPTIGVSRTGAMPTGAFVAPLAAAATGTDSTVVWLEPMPKDACATSLSDAKVAVSWKNTSAHTSDDATFPACSAGKPALSPELKTGPGTLEFTVTVLGKGGDTFTLSPGTATIQR